MTIGAAKKYTMIKWDTLAKLKKNIRSEENTHDEHSGMELSCAMR